MGKGKWVKMGQIASGKRLHNELKIHRVVFVCSKIQMGVEHLFHEIYYIHLFIYIL